MRPAFAAAAAPEPLGVFNVTFLWGRRAHPRRPPLFVFRWLQWFKRKPLIVGEAPREGIDPDDVQVGTLYRLAHASGKVRCRVDAIESRALLGDCGYFIVVFSILPDGQRSIISLDEFARRVCPWN